MKKALLSFLLLIFSLITIGQIKFEPGYYINNNDEKINCLIKNEDWFGSPKNIEIKLKEDSESITKDINQVKSFEVAHHRYNKFKVLYDRSYFESGVPGPSNIPDYIHKTALLKVIVEGKVSLFKMGDENRFYFQVEGSDIEHLIYKKYLDDNIIKQNNAYKSQLLDKMQGDCVNVLDVNDLKFVENDLKNLIVKYNECYGGSSFVNAKKRNRNLFNLHIKPGIRYSNLKVSGLIRKTKLILTGVLIPLFL